MLALAPSRTSQLLSTLPISGVPKPLHLVPYPAPIHQPSETILVVDDEEGLLTLMAECLEMAGYTVLCASDGNKALSVCRDHDGPIHLLISDVVMPEIGGPALVEIQAPDTDNSI